MSLRGLKRRSNSPPRVGIASSGYALLAMTIILTSCSALDVFSATSVPVVLTETPLPSPTTVWFPPSETSAPQVFSTPPATPEMRPGLGDIIATDDFSSTSVWDVAASDQGSAAIDNHRLTLAVQKDISMISLQHNLTLNDFYAEITASPGLCRAGDEYGLLIRARAVAYYRFALSCNGAASAERISNKTREILHTPLPSSDAPLGAPGEVRIGVWAVGTEMRLFLNGHYQFSVTDANYSSGALGVFVQSAGDSAVTVSFSDLSIQDVTFIPPTRTPQP